MKKKVSGAKRPVQLRNKNLTYPKLAIVIPMLLFCALSVFPQELPDKIRGYKVHKTDVTVNEKNSENSKFVEIEFGEPVVESFTVTGINLRFNNRLTVYGQSGTVDFITFKDFKVNGISVVIDEYENGFDFEKGVAVDMEDPVRVFVPVTGLLQGAFKELKAPKDNWRVTGRVFVFGKFRKFGFKFKRVVPVDIDLMIKNPTRKSNERDGNPGSNSRVVDQERNVGGKRFAAALV